MAYSNHLLSSGISTFGLSNGSGLAMPTICAICLFDYWVARQIRFSNIKISSYSTLRSSSLDLRLHNCECAK